MKLLLDSHALFWWLIGSSQLSSFARSAITDLDNEVIASVVNFYELLFKAKRRRLPFPSEALEQALRTSDFPVLPITQHHAEIAAGLAWHHGDPWDRLLAAQARAEQACLLSRDVVFDDIGIDRRW